MNRTPRIVVGVDGFESSEAALRWAIHQAKLTGAVVDAVTAWQIPAGSGLIPAADLPDYQDDARIILTEAIAEMCTVDTEVEVRPYVTEGRAGPVLVAAAEGADLLVVGCRPAAWIGHGSPTSTGRDARQEINAEDSAYAEEMGSYWVPNPPDKPFPPRYFVARRISVHLAITTARAGSTGSCRPRSASHVLERYR